MVAVMKGHKFMKIVSVIISAIAFLFSLSGCSGYPHSSWENGGMDKGLSGRWQYQKLYGSTD